MNSNSPASLENMRQQAKELQASGHLKEAIQLQVDVINSASQLSCLQPEDYHRFGVMLFVAKDFSAAITAFERVRQLQPNFPGLSQNLGLSLILSNRFKEALTELRLANAEHPDDLNILDGLAHAYGKLGELEHARTHGEKSLLVKDLEAMQRPSHLSLLQETPPPFCLDSTRKNVISFSLFGSKTKYTSGAVKNAITAAGLYPGWQCRFYCDDSVPASTRQALTEAKAEVKMMPRPPRWTDGLFWRFQVMNDPSINRFLVRDCDSLINIRERRAVDEWLTSKYCFHIMRDHSSHTDLILAGLWGGVAGALPPLAELLEGFHYNSVTGSRTADQLFLGQKVWPLIKNSCLIHDSLYRVFGAKHFPTGSDLPKGRNVGDNNEAFDSK